MIIEEVELTAVTMRIRHLPPHVNRQMRGLLFADLPPRPTRPTKSVSMADGHVEQIEVGQGDPRYDEWRAEVTAWEEMGRQAEVSAAEQFNDLLEDYCCLAWRWRGTDEWKIEPPTDWQYPTTLFEHRISQSGNRKLDYLRTEVLIGVGDIGALYEAAVLTDLEGREVQLHLDGFRVVSIARDENPTAESSGERDLEFDVPRGNSNGTDDGNLIGRLVRAITGSAGGGGSAATG